MSFRTSQITILAKLPAFGALVRTRSMAWARLLALLGPVASSAGCSESSGDGFASQEQELSATEEDAASDPATDCDIRSQRLGGVPKFA